MTQDDLRALRGLLIWHQSRWSTYANRALDRRASRHTKEAHTKNALFHQQAAQTLTACLEALKGVAE